MAKKGREAVNQKKILFVDDEPMIIKLMAKRLRANKFEVETALNGKEAFEKAREWKPDLILLDIFMPGMDGYETCRCLKNDPVTSLIPVIMFTASLEDQFIQKGIQAGAEDVVNKPFVAELLETIHKVFDEGGIDHAYQDED